MDTLELQAGATLARHNNANECAQYRHTRPSKSSACSECLEGEKHQISPITWPDNASIVKAEMLRRQKRRPLAVRQLVTSLPQQGAPARRAGSRHCNHTGTPYWDQYQRERECQHGK